MTAYVPEGFPKLDKNTREWICRAMEPVPDCSRMVPCASCRGRRNRRSGMTKQRAARKAVEAASGASAAKFVGQLGNEESWHGLPVRVEVKSGAQTKPAATRYLADEAQAEASRALGDNRPFVDILMPPGMSDGIVQCRLSTWAAVCDAMAFGG